MFGSSAQTIDSPGDCDFVLDRFVQPVSLLYFQVTRCLRVVAAQQGEVASRKAATVTRRTRHPNGTLVLNLVTDPDVQYPAVHWR